MLASYALSIARRRRGFIEGSAPPRRAATVTSLIRRVKILPFLASATAFLCLTLAHLECPAMAIILLRASHQAKNNPDDRAAARRQIENRGARAPAGSR